jgi:hypothetical protein
MKFPRCYLAIDKKYQLPPLETIQKWVQCNEAVYVEGVSEFDDNLHIQTVDFLEIHYLIHSRVDDDVQLIIFHGKAVNSFLLMALGSHLKKVYWADSEEHLIEINTFAENIECLEIFEDACRRADLALSALTDIIRARTGSGLAGEDAYWRSVSGRENFGNESEAKIVMRNIGRDITRAGVLRRIDLEDEPAEHREDAVQLGD